MGCPECKTMRLGANYCSNCGTAFIGKCPKCGEMESIKVINAGVCLKEIKLAEEKRKGYIKEKLGSSALLFGEEYSGRKGLIVPLFVCLISLYLIIPLSPESDGFPLNSVNLSLLMILFIYLLFTVLILTILKKKFSKEFPELAATIEGKNVKNS